MPITYTIHPEIGLSVIRWTYPVADADLAEAYLQLYRDPEWVPGFLEFVDTRGAAGSRVSPDGLRDLAYATAPYTSLAPMRTAVVVGSDLGFGLTRMFQAFAEGSGEEIALFRDPIGAFDWLGIGPDERSRVWNGMAVEVRPGGFFVIKGMGEVSPQDYEECARLIWRHPTFQDGARVLTDFSGCRVNWSAAEIRRSREMFERDRPPVRARSAILTDDDLTFGIAAVSRALIPDGSLGEMEMFRDSQKALEWLGEGESQV